MNHTKDDRINEIISKDYLSSLVLEKYDIDYVKHKNKKLSEVCNTGLNEILMEINNLKNHDFYRLKEWEPGLLCDYIVNVHHGYLKKSFLKCISKMKALFSEGKKNSDILKEIKQIYSELEIHFKKEEKMLFPYIKELSEINKKMEKYEVPPFGSISDLIKVIKKEHSEMGVRFKKNIDAFKNEPAKSNQSIKKEELYGELKVLLLDFLYHIHLENNMLFPKAIVQEKKLKRHFKINNKKK
ncbi:MAG: Iron-sulfur cluster repair protein YtfE [Ignavibacteria bacterium]|nr:Iron-sulfur cluster repair protein YtfE [Ignavibacteria bacterium]